MIYNSYQVADIIGVNVSTIKRWTDSGKLSCYQTAGGHRKFHVKHIKEFLKQKKYNSNDVSISKLIGTNKSLIDAVNTKNNKILIKHCYKHLKSSNDEKFLSLINSLIFKGYGLGYIYDNIFTPMLEKIGIDWEKNIISISEEHLMTVKIKKFLSNINITFSDKKYKIDTYCFTLSDDSHDLSLYMYESLVSSKNIKVFNLGASLPIEDFIKLSNKQNVDIIFISIVYIKNISVMNKQINLLCDHFLDTNTKIYLKGAGVHKLNINSNNYIIANSFTNLQSNIFSYILN
tara:strand:- start:729 stop:1595 length:867 start_codon:yes stop_codon:yes gene_type:complete